MGSNRGVFSVLCALDHGCSEVPKFQHQRVEQCVPSWQNCGSGSHKLNGSETQQSSCRS